MPYLKLVESASHAVTEARSSPVRIGREPGSTIVVGGDAAKVVSTRHAEARYEGPAWVLTDLGSRNGTYLNGRRLAAPAALTVGDVIRLGESGTEFKVVAVTEGLAATQPEHPGIEAPAPRPAEARAYGVTLLAAATGKRYEARGTRIRLGRRRECEVQPVEASDTVVSRVHGYDVGDDGRPVARALCRRDSHVQRARCRPHPDSRLSRVASDHDRLAWHQGSPGRAAGRVCGRDRGLHCPSL